jgi:DNA primase catalytic subunit
MKEAVILCIKYIKSLGTDKTDVTPMRSDGQITADTKQKSKIPNSVRGIYKVRNENIFNT